jgi:lipid-binding SYLF domain-containing protein
MMSKTMHALILPAIAVLCLGLQACSSEPLTTSQKEEKRAEVRNMANQSLEQLYAAHPGARDAVTNAAGYAVFSDIGFKLLYGGGQKGNGIAINNATKQETFMKMWEAQPGLGLGASKFRLILVFDTPDAFDNFVTSGWEAGANTMAAAKNKTEGGAYAGAVSVSSGVHMFQVTEAGLIVGVSITGGKFYKDKELN